MSVASRVETLKRKHRRLENEIFEFQQSPSTNHLDIVAMKREKLKLKDEIERFNKSLH